MPLPPPHSLAWRLFGAFLAVTFAGRIYLAVTTGSMTLPLAGMVGWAGEPMAFLAAIVSMSTIAIAGTLRAMTPGSVARLTLTLDGPSRLDVRPPAKV